MKNINIDREVTQNKKIPDFDLMSRKK